MRDFPCCSWASAAINTGARSRETSLPFQPPGEHYLYGFGKGGVCVLQFLPCQPSILERMKQPWRIRAAAADLSCQPEDPGCPGPRRPLPPPRARNSPCAQGRLPSPRCHPLKIPPWQGGLSCSCTVPPRVPRPRAAHCAGKWVTGGTPGAALPGRWDPVGGCLGDAGAGDGPLLRPGLPTEPGCKWDCRVQDGIHVPRDVPL